MQLGCVFQDMEPPKSNSIVWKGTQFFGPKRSVQFSHWCLMPRSFSIKRYTRQEFLVNRLIWNLQQWLYRVNMVFLHFQKDRNCELCERTNISRAPCRKHTGNPVPRAENAGDKITTNHRYAVEVQDLATQRMQSYVQEFTKVSRAVGKAESH